MKQARHSGARAQTKEQKKSRRTKKERRSLEERKAMQKRKQDRTQARWEWNRGITAPKEHAMRENIKPISPERRAAILARISEKTFAEKKKRGMLRRPKPQLTPAKLAA